ncbi:uncharacterized protein si:ch73-95l15.5 [Lampris incognitus]|uniref:uncharacterized protein si:ch73-95l15.5 n=1 Tax=Lampris incognitus TaxID=2546036 RepID=UPI0024B4BAE2|nr:uncharacterized protein si:ch73-95l15.5 [Lampris incognitus]
MFSRGTNEACLICGGALQGNQRRWLFGGLKKRGGEPRTPTESLRGGSMSQSCQSSPWGSTLSLGSSVSLSRSQVSLCSPSKGMDLLSVLSHILGQSVPRGGGRGEFLCGKCVCVLERVFKFDTVIARVRVLSSERLQKLTQEKDNIKRWVRYNYCQRHPEDFEEDSEGDKEGYREMLRENMALSEYECWSERWDTCPYFIRTGKRCRKGKGCEGCDSLRVSDSDYESVCGVPRRLPSQPFSPLALSRDKSQSMPLHWSRVPSNLSSLTSLVGSSLSLRASSCAESVQSLDSLDGTDPFDLPGDQPLNFVLKELRSIESMPVCSPSGSQIPVLGRKGKRHSGGEVKMVSPAVKRVLDYGDEENGGDEMDGEVMDVLTELRDEFMPLHRENSTSRMHHAVRQLRGQLDQALARIRTLEAELKGPADNTEVNGSADWAPPPQGESGSSLLQSFASSLHSRERVIQECVGVIRRLCVDGGASTELPDHLKDNLKELLSDNTTALENWRSSMSERENKMEREIEALRKAGKDQERDLDILHTVLQCNQDIINDLRLALAEKEQMQREVEKERAVWRSRDQALTAVLQEKETLLHCLKEELESCKSNMQALSDSPIGRSSPGGGTEAALVNQLQEKESLFAAWLQDREEKSATMCLEVTKLTAVLQDYQVTVQGQQESHSRTVSSLRDQLRDTQTEVRERRRERKEVERERQNDRDQQEREERKLRESLEKRDKLIEQLLLDAEERDHLFRELQHTPQLKHQPVTAVKHTL